MRGICETLSNEASKPPGPPRPDKTSWQRGSESTSKPPDEVEMLQLPVGEPVMVLKRRTYTIDDVIVEFARGVHAASRFSWTYDFTLPD
ncbi:UTRA domain-containing protein [Nocardia sp. NPDC050406]|uniref:UTRA domain-containing protein n=1 Tax=Nocardia sp. NPDC050406 TaxID=3364318 RepID=UPI003798A5CA